MGKTETPTSFTQLCIFPAASNRRPFIDLEKIIKVLACLQSSPESNRRPFIDLEKIIRFLRASDHQTPTSFTQLCIFPAASNRRTLIDLEKIIRFLRAYNHRRQATGNLSSI